MLPAYALRSRRLRSLLALACSVIAADRPITIDSNIPTRAELEVRYKGHKLLVYAFATNQFKPYVRELYTLRGENVLRDAPPDHLHHHGMMYAVWVNGINFWEENDAPGVEKHVELPLQYATIDPKGVPTAQLMEVIHWLAPTNRTTADSLEAALLVEQRTLTLTVDEKNQEVALRWESQFEVGPNAGKVTLDGPELRRPGPALAGVVQSRRQVPELRRPALHRPEHAERHSRPLDQRLPARWAGAR